MDRLIECQQDEDRLIYFLRAQKKPYTVVYHDGRVRSPEQNRLQWMWANEVARKDGESARYWQADWKLRWGIPMLVAEDEQIAKLWQVVEKAFPLYEDQRNWLIDTEFPVSRLMDVKQFTRFLDQIYHWYSARGYDLTEPEREAA